jgi:hypothetical protein
MGGGDVRRDADGSTSGSAVSRRGRIVPVSPRDDPNDPATSGVSSHVDGLPRFVRAS